MELLQQIGEHLQRGDNDMVDELTRGAVENGILVFETLVEPTR